jgi:hypothetical protein
MAVAGLTRLRKHQFGRQVAFGTPVAAVAAYPFSGVPSPDRAWSDREVDVGSIDPVAAPVLGAPDLTSSLTDPGVEYNSLPLLFAAIFGGAETPTGAGDAKTWAWAPASTTVDAVDAFTYEFGDDVTTDWYQFGDSILESLELVGPTGLGPFTGSYGWRHGSMASSGATDLPDSPTVPTADLEVDPNAALLYLKDTGIYIASSVSGLAAGQVTDALYGLTWRVTGDVDQKRWANGDKSFDVDAYSRATRMIELVAVWAKTSDIVGVGSESDAWMSDEAITRYVRIYAESAVKISTGPDVFYSLELVMPMRYFTREETNEGGNSTVTLTGHAFFDPEDFEGVLTAEVVCTRATI